MSDQSTKDIEEEPQRNTALALEPNTPSKKQRMEIYKGASSGTKDAAMTAPENTIMKDANTISKPKKMIEST